MSESNLPAVPEVKGLVLSDKTYNNAKFFVQIVLPALAVLYASLSEFWGFPRVQEVVGTIGALALFLGIILRVSSASYSNVTSGPAVGTPAGTFVVTEDVEGNKSVKLEFTRDPAEIIDGDNIVFNLKREDDEPTN
jgi:hypothetical protein